MIFKYIIIGITVISVSGCSKIVDRFKSSETEKKSTEETDLQRKEKELDLREKELALEREKLNIDLEKNTEQQIEKPQKEEFKSNVDLRNFATLWFGSIKDGTSWEVTIVDFDGKNFRGRNTIYWKSSPDGFSTNFTGTVDKLTREVVMYEDKKARGSGKFVGKINSQGNRMSGTWTRYSDGGSFSWNLERMEKGDAGY